MLTHISAFIFYTLAMMGLMLVGFIIYKKFMLNPINSNTNLIKVIDNYPIGPKKTLMVVKVQNEKFLIASDSERTTFLTKLADGENINEVISKNMEIITDSPKRQEIKINEIKNELNLKSLIPQKTVKNEIQEDIQYDELKQARLQKLQKQFNELYNQETKAVVNQGPSEKNQKILSRILEELNQVPKKQESKY